MDKALLYETIVRRAFPNVYIAGCASAADLYRKMELGGSQGLSKQEQEDNAFEAATCLCSAILDFKFRCAMEQNEDASGTTFDTCLQLLEQPTLERINKCMKLIMLALEPARK